MILLLSLICFLLNPTNVMNFPDNHDHQSKDVQCSRAAFQNFRKLVDMENTNSIDRRWEEMEIDVLVRIFQTFDITELISGISRVCSSWRVASCDPILWKTINLGNMSSNFIKIPSPPYVYVDGRSDKTLMRFLKIGLGLSRGNVRCLIFHLNLYLKDAHLMYAAERCPQLRRLVLPAWNCITKARISEAVSKWPHLESLTMPTIRDPSYIMEVIGKSCENFTQLKVMGPCNVGFASGIVTFLPNIKVLSLRCSLLHKEALELILEKLVHLEVLNISHCLLVEIPPYPTPKKVFRVLDQRIIEKASRLRQFLTCQEDSCIFCQRVIVDDGLLRWYKYEEEFWCTDEVNSLHVDMSNM